MASFHQLAGMGQLIRRDVDPGDVGPAVLGHPDAGAADAATGVQQMLTRLDLKPVGHLPIHVQDGRIVAPMRRVMVTIVQAEMPEAPPDHLVVDVAFPVVVKNGLMLGVHTVSWGC